MADDTFDEQECLAIINGPDQISAYELLLNNRPDLERKFEKADKALRALLADSQTTFPDARFYTACGGFNLMLGRSHGNREQSQQELVALSGQARIGDGDF